ncbi:Ras- protein Rab-4B [Actinomortierella ambigua]|uniref:Ras- protein Rab-4B n=1 Tax=Actinomortierella ambigua TaxID=1343610 RepID=A0A9P6UB65_9FUNG|nr:Ras- protein Rab-4B [Actinomortierella ambigua]
MSSYATYDFLLKFLITGDSGTGKSCLLHQFVENKFKEGSTHTIGVEFGSRIVTIGKNQVKLQIWDTAGQERFRSVTRSYYRGAAGALLVYDITNRSTFTSITKWIADARKLAGADIALMLVGNKLDLEEREVSYLEASRFAQENEMAFLETSALTGEGVEETFLKCGRAILTKIETGQLDPETPGSGIQYGDSSLRRISQKSRPQRQKSGCC